MSNLVELFDNVVEFQNYNGSPLAAGKMYVYALGRTRLMDTWSDVDGESLNPNPIILDNLGQCHCYCSDDYDYTIIVCDQFDNEIFSVDKYLLSKGEHSHADVAVAPSEHIGVSSYHVGEVTVYVPYLTGDVGKTYEGILPIVVNNDVNRISAQHIPLGVQEPLYFVEDSETACILGFSGQTIPEGVMVESSLGFDNNKITGYNGSAFSAGNEYEAGNYISITDNTINVVNLPTSADVQNIVDVATSGLMPSGNYLTKESADTLYAPTGNYLTALPVDVAYTGLVAEVSADIVSQIPSTAGLATTAQLNEKLDKSDSANFYPMTGNPSNFLTAHQSLQGYATEQWVEGKGYLTSVNIPESANWNSTYNTVHDNSGNWSGNDPTPQISVTGINGIKISESGDKVVFEVSANYATENWVASQGYLTAHQSLTAYQTKEGMTAYQPAGNYYSASNPSGFITEVPAGTMNESEFEYSSGMITAYNGSAFKAGDEFPESATEAIQVVTANSADWNVTTETVNTNSGAWGGSALPISAGPGIKFDIVNDTLVASTDEIVLFETTAIYGAGVCNLSESLKNFERIGVKPTRGYTGTPNPGGAGPWNYFDTDQIVGGTIEPFQAVCPYIMEYTNWKISQYNPNADCTVLTWNRGFQKNMQDNSFITSDSFTACVGIQKIVGIHRIAGGN